MCYLRLKPLRNLPMIDSRRRLRLYLLTGLLITSSLHTLATDEDLLNERFFEPGRAIEIHWQIDCAKTDAQVLTLLARLADQRQADCDFKASAVQLDELKALLDSLQKCGFIYNSRGNRRFKPCPDYASAYRGLDTGIDTLRCRSAEPVARLELLRQTRAALSCGQEP